MSDGLRGFAKEMVRRLQRWIGPQTIGAASERAAESWLRRHRGFTVIVRNWRNPRNRREEIDLVCWDEDVLVFVEVKARAANALVPGFYSIDRRKKQALRRAIRSYLRGLSKQPHTHRVDVVEISLSLTKAPEEILHFENVSLE